MNGKGKKEDLVKEEKQEETEGMKQEAGEKESKVEDVEVTIEKLKEEIASLKDRYLRAHAEMDNMRKRLERERRDIVKFGNESLLRDMLVVYDAIEKAITTGKEMYPDNRNFIEGMEMIEKLFLETLKQHGVEPIKAKGEVFDPKYHEAMMQVERDDLEEGVVADEIVKGFMLHDRVLRPARVSVSKGIEKTNREEA